MSEIVTKGEFAKLMNVSAGRVSQWINEGKLKKRSLVGAGRSAKINVELARADLRETLDISQRLGNGLDTKLESDAAPEVESTVSVPRSLSTDEQIKAEKLKASRLQNERLEAERRARAGEYIKTEDAQAEMVRAVGLSVKIFEGGLAAMADLMATTHGVAARDALHTLRLGFNDVRARVMDDLNVEVGALPNFVEDSIEDGDSVEESAPSGA